MITTTKGNNQNEYDYVTYGNFLCSEGSVFYILEGGGFKLTYIKTLSYFQVIEKSKMTADSYEYNKKMEQTSNYVIIPTK